jgi:hypothetical protein
VLSQPETSTRYVVVVATLMGDSCIAPSGGQVCRCRASDKDRNPLKEDELPVHGSCAMCTAETGRALVF